MLTPLTAYENFKIGIYWYIQINTQKKQKKCIDSPPMVDNILNNKKKN